MTKTNNNQAAKPETRAKAAKASRPAAAAKKQRRKEKVRRDLERAIHENNLAGMADYQVEQVNRDLAKSRRPLDRRNPKGARGKSKIEKYAASLADPWSWQGVHCPVSLNPGTTLDNALADTASSLLSLAVPAFTTSQLVFFPGHLSPVAPIQLSDNPGELVYSQMDAQSFHSRAALQCAGGVYATVGPTPSSNGVSTLQPACMFLTTGVTMGNYDGTSITSSPVAYDVPLPYTPNVSTNLDGVHARWQLVSMGVRIKNITTGADVAGDVVSVQFANASGLPNAAVVSQSTLSANRSFRIHGTCREGMEITWIPRSQDLAYWHSIRSESSSLTNTLQTDMRGAAMAVFLNNTSSQGLTFTVQAIFNWMLAGNYYISVSNPVEYSDLLHAPVKQAIAHMQNRASTAAVAPVVMAHASKTVDEADSLGNRLAGMGFEAVKNSGLSNALHRLGAGAVLAAGKGLASLVAA